MPPRAPQKNKEYDYIVSKLMDIDSGITTTVEQYEKVSKQLQAHTIELNNLSNRIQNIFEYKFPEVEKSIIEKHSSCDIKEVKKKVDEMKGVFDGMNFIIRNKLLTLIMILGLLVLTSFAVSKVNASAYREGIIEQIEQIYKLKKIAG